MDQHSKTREKNPLLTSSGLPPFHLIQPGHVVPAVTQVIGEIEGKVESLEAHLEPTWDGLLEPLEKLDLPLEYAWNPVVHLLNVRNSEALRKAHETMLGNVVALGLRLRQSEPIYQGMKALRQSDLWNRLSNAQRRVVELKLRNGEHAGVGLTGEAKNRFIQMEREISQISTDFSNHVLDATKAFELIITEEEDAKGWPESLRNLAAQSFNQARRDTDVKATPERGPWRITLDHPSFVPFMQHSRRRDQREKVYRAFITRASEGNLDNTEIIQRMLRLRKEKAELLGFGSYAEFSLASKMAPSVTAVETMFQELQRASSPHAFKDLQDLKRLARRQGQTEPIAHWDLPFWAERLREKRFDYTEDQLRPYFPLPRVLRGLFSLCQKLFGILIEPADGEAPVWHADVRYFRVLDQDGKRVASFYLDPYSRPQEKRGGAWMDNCLVRRRLDHEIRLPVVHLCCNSTPPVGEKPSLMSFSEVNTLFHEFGHGLQGVLTTVDLADVAGVNGIEWDAVELASQFMENWCYHKPTLIGMTKHVDSGEPLPDDLFQKVLAARTYRSGSLMMRQLELGMIDMELHHSYTPAGPESPFDLHRRISMQMSPLPPLPEDRFLCAFSHIFGGGYAAGYYSYKWAEVLSADAFAAFEEIGLENESAIAKLGRRFRETVLAPGGSRHPMDVFKDFRGREPSTEPLLRHNGLVAPSGSDE